MLDHQVRPWKKAILHGPKYNSIASMVRSVHNAWILAGHIPETGFLVQNSWHGLIIGVIEVKGTCGWKVSKGPGCWLPLLCWGLHNKYTPKVLTMMSECQLLPTLFCLTTVVWVTIRRYVLLNFTFFFHQYHPFPPTTYIIFFGVHTNYLCYLGERWCSQ